MLCNVCGKNPATVHLTEIIDNQMNELHLCEECARQKSMQMEQQFGLSDLLAGLADFEKPAVEKEQNLKCANCGLTYNDFKKIGRLGCGDCLKRSTAQACISGNPRYAGANPCAAVTLTLRTCATACRNPSRRKNSRRRQRSATRSKRWRRNSRRQEGKRNEDQRPAAAFQRMA